MFAPNQTTFTEADKIIVKARLAAETALSGLIAGTLLETASGWRPVEKLMRGDEVYTYDGGLRIITRMDRNLVDARESAPEGLVWIAGGTLSNSHDLLVLPNQKLLIETCALGGISTLVRAAELIGQPGIERVDAGYYVQIFRPVLAEEEVLWANAGLLFHCAGADEDRGFFPTATGRDIATIFGMEPRTGMCLAA